MLVCEEQPVARNSTIDLSLNTLQTMNGPDREPSLLARFHVAPGSKVRVNEADPPHDWSGSEEVVSAIRFYAQKLGRLQYAMYAERKRSLLIILQGMDAAGKDGAARHLVACMNPAGCRVVGFKKPSRSELAHDFLWRIHAQVPAKGEAVIFNRSHYEDVLVVRVHGMVDASSCWRRYDMINEFERLLVTENNTTILKFLLNISKSEQLERFRQRLVDPARHWKISEADYEERGFWDQYMSAFEDMLSRTSTRYAPWYLIPSNQRWYRDLVISQIVSTTMENLGMKVPEPTVDLSRIRRRYHAAADLQISDGQEMEPTGTGVPNLCRVFGHNSELSSGQVERGGVCHAE